MYFGLNAFYPNIFCLGSLTPIDLICLISVVHDRVLLGLGPDRPRAHLPGRAQVGGHVQGGQEVPHRLEGDDLSLISYFFS